MTTQNDRDFMKRFLKASVARDPADFLAFLAPSFVAHVGGGAKNREEFVQHMGVFNLAFSDLQVELLDVVSDGEMIVARTSWKGTHDGSFMGMAPTGKKIEIEAYIMERCKDGRSLEHRSLFDQLTMMQQLGVIPQAQSNR